MHDNENQNEEPNFETLDFTKPTFEFKPKQVHTWRQQGVYLVCKTCDIEHASYIGIKKILVGINDQGQPILKDRFF